MTLWGNSTLRTQRILTEQMRPDSGMPSENGFEISAALTHLCPLGLPPSAPGNPVGQRMERDVSKANTSLIVWPAVGEAHLPLPTDEKPGDHSNQGRTSLPQPAPFPRCFVEGAWPKHGASPEVSKCPLTDTASRILETRTRS